jgi:hypothetical protein
MDARKLGPADFKTGHSRLNNALSRSAHQPEFQNTVAVLGLLAAGH